ncbi:DUF6778 family protein [uncultured Tateyamaria sp.]|uniref:DUF6778 family protein n=1 Tax=Tateyamaria sp. 1078 TaxID=3417464 RepID=UPI00260A36C1|nr:DUF6778 family protein [uncultured Tateyamaria sp.]
MKRIKITLLLMMGGLVSACGAPIVPTNTAPFEATPLSSANAPVEAAAQAIPAAAPLTDVQVKAITITVPRSLTVSEANRYLPKGDIVWRGDPIGDRHQQVADIFDTAMTRGAQSVNGTLPVSLDITVKRFHALTEKARYSVGGVHNITFELTLRDPETGAALAETREVHADLDGFGGQQAINADAQGQTQKVRITDHLAEVIRQELTRAEGFQNPRLGFVQAMNHQQK